MIIFVKLIVLVCCINAICASHKYYCEICVNHTLCKYKTEGPSAACMSYDSSALLTNADIFELVNRINERRNFVAMGYSKILPRAANMKKIKWSTVLASFAQRWADQCDSSIHPDKEDQCRDSENVNVGQTISSILGPSPGLNVKSFVEMWFIQGLDYAGSVTYYNKSRDDKTKYFTQLIWANTEYVGCGKAKFYIHERNAMLERLICNFAPKGNINGKPVYAIGYPVTQCASNMIADNKYKGLCKQEDSEMLATLNIQRPPKNSLLRILNLSSDSVKHEIDPIRNNLKQTNVNSNPRDEERNQKTRHILLNKTYAAPKRITPLRKQNIRQSFMMNNSKNEDDYHYQNERGHSHLYHGHEPLRYNYEITTVPNTNQDLRRYDYTNDPMNMYSNNNYRKYNQNEQCTRKITPIQNDCSTCKIPCTRETGEFCQQTTFCPSTSTELPFSDPPVEEQTCQTVCSSPTRELCTCCTKQTCPTKNANCNYDPNIQCNTNNARGIMTSHYYTTICPILQRKFNDFSDYRKSGTFQYYDNIPNIVVRSGNQNLPAESSSQKGFSFFGTSNINKLFKTIYEEKETDLLHKYVTDQPKHKSQDPDYLYHSYDSSLRKKRQLDEPFTLKPFWQIDEYNYNNAPQLKNIKYTTLSNKKNRKTRKNMPAKWLTESITLNIPDYAERLHVTEKYLSFDELMHLRKTSDGYSLYDFRRKDKATKDVDKTTKKAKDKEKSKSGDKDKSKSGDKERSKSGDTEKTKAGDKEKTKASKSPKETTKSDKSNKETTNTQATTTTPVTLTTEYTANTPFERKKHCTRKLTCTWTAFSTNEAGEITYNGPIDVGSRTPPGYVDGCTRTSTCTRDYMDRNKISTLPGDPESSSDSTPVEDEDYCERRSLNVQRRNVFKNHDFASMSITTPDIISDVLFKSYVLSVTEASSEVHDCICNEKFTRKKRQEGQYSGGNNDHCDDSNNLSYGDLYYMLLNTILKTRKDNTIDAHQCPCNSSVGFRPVMFSFLLFLFIHVNHM